ncbi:hypothetical protein GYMLUDRAFT_985810 [Collybiopsis luxurians FD-317 M1]|uniref:Uncharacterized protein n=1 Tax=Collybiopsis luxurians FD-317 M1 TaxID=944289 RepID=A0A0D0C755_9AGAR|nr:hypothetical protein GYMLUDRAFT_985810 [Collybiopsis luxurians FD-317 M1]
MLFYQDHSSSLSSKKLGLGWVLVWVLLSRRQRRRIRALVYPSNQVGRVKQLVAAPKPKLFPKCKNWSYVKHKKNTLHTPLNTRVGMKEHQEHLQLDLELLVRMGNIGMDIRSLRLWMTVNLCSLDLLNVQQ